MAIMAPLRVTTAFVGLIIGYYAGVILEYKWKYSSTIGALVNTLSTVHTISGRLADYYTDDDDSIVFDTSACCDDFEDDSDESTTYSSNDDMQ